ncbi:MAG: hypothetical protein NUV80_03740 [Candidatus Berkelbacteria bacterium]|nr:hypothetical protein [Candidatus Berkelbacteria bacterium]
MPINYGLVDPTEGMNRGLGTLAQALQYRQQMERQAQQDAMTAKSHGLQDTLSQMKIDTSTAEQNALMGATGQPDLQSALGTQLKAKMEAEAQKLQAEKLTRYSTVLEHLSKAPFDDATKTEYLKAAIGKDPDFAEFLKSATIQTPLNPGDFELKTLYGPGGATKSVPVSKTGGYTSESGWSLTPPLKPDTLSPEAEAQRARLARIGKTTVNVAPAADEVEAMAQLFAAGKIDAADITKRGSLAPKVFKRAVEINAGLDPRAQQADNAAYKSSLTMQEKQLGQMGSFVKNMGKQIDQVKKISNELSSFDTRLLNVPLRLARGRIAGSAQQVKYDMYLTEIENEIGKLATGSAASISELSVGAQQKWEKIHDKNLSIKDMLSLLEETKNAGLMRMDSVKEQIADTKARRSGRRSTDTPPTGADTLPQGFKAGW